jgi:sugar-specific transcriptional regulator TrmB
MMAEALQELVKDFEEKMMVIYQQLVKESEDLKNEVRELQRTCEILRAEAANSKAEYLKLKNGILHAGETMRNFLGSIVTEADEAAAEATAESQEAGVKRFNRQLATFCRSGLKRRSFADINRKACQPRVSPVGLST